MGRMHMKTMRVIDRFAGAMICSGVAAWVVVWRWLWPRAPWHPAQAPEVRSVLVIKCLGIGSIVLTMPTLAAIRTQFPNAKIHYLSFANNRKVLELLSDIDERHFIDTSSLWAFARTLVREIAALRRANIDIAFDLEFFAKFPLLVAFLSGARYCAGFALTLEPWRSALLDVSGYYNHYRHVKDIFLSLVYRVATNDPYYEGFEAFAACFGDPCADAGDEARATLAAKLPEWLSASASEPLFVINPNAGKELATAIRRWPVDRFAALATRLIRERGGRVVFTGAPAERDYVESIMRLLPEDVRASVLNSAGMLSLCELLALCEKASVFVTTDSGPMHLAALTNVPIVGLFFADTPTLYGPLATRVRNIFPDRYCLPAYTVYTGKASFLTDDRIPAATPVQPVFDATLALL